MPPSWGIRYVGRVQPETATSGDEAHAPESGNRASRTRQPLPADGPVTVIRGSRSLFDLGLPSLWSYRELLFFLVWRDVKVRYKQTVVGVLWVVLQPMATMLIFTFVFNRIANLTSGSVPYPLFAYTGLLPWQLFTAGIAGATASIVSNGNLISKIYFPRLIIPAASVLAGLVDFGVSLAVLAGLMWYYHYAPGIQVLSIPLFISLAICTALAAGLWLSLLNIRFRDVQHTLPFVLQAWIFLTPVAYPASAIPLSFRPLIGINPMTSVVDGFRWALIGGQGPWAARSFWVSLATVSLLLVTGVLFFRRMEKTFADLI